MNDSETRTMLKLIMCVKRLPTLSRRQFDEHWAYYHAPLVCRHARVLGIRSYRQTVPLTNAAAQRALQQGRGAGSVDFDGCAELWWDNLATHMEARNTAEGRSALQELIEDERRFIDLPQCQLWYGEERAIL